MRLPPAFIGVHMDPPESRSPILGGQGRGIPTRAHGNAGTLRCGSPALVHTRRIGDLVTDVVTRTPGFGCVGVATVRGASRARSQSPIITAEVDEAFNQRSQRVATKLGMRRSRQIVNPVFDIEVDVWKLICGYL
jgi:hypothetical protein